MTPKERRDRLFKRSKPVLRAIQLRGETGYATDMGILWAAYQKGAFVLPEGLDQQQFADAVEAQLRGYETIWFIEDKTPAFKSGQGPIGLVGIVSHDMAYTLSGRPFPWASKRNVLRGSVAALSKICAMAKCGVAFVNGDTKSYKFLKCLKRYDSLFYVGKTGRESWLFSARGRAS
jgi:hypothetical protein